MRELVFDLSRKHEGWLDLRRTKSVGEPSFIFSHYKKLDEYFIGEYVNN